MVPRPSRGATLIELAVVLALLGLVGSVIGVSLTRQQRFYRGAGELLGARQNVRDAMEVLSNDIRGLAAADTVSLMADSAIEFFSNVGSAIVCSNSGRGELGLSGSGGSRGNTFTAFLNQPDTGDIAVFYRAGTDSVAPAWERARIAGFSTRSLEAICPDSSAFAVGEGGRGFLLTVGSPLTSLAAPGTPVRFVRRVRYSLYHAGDGEWYLGYRRCNGAGPPVCGAVQPLSGPYRGFNSDPGRSGLVFKYFDTSGAPTTTPLALARITITARSESHQQIQMERHPWRPADSAVVAIAVRNRAP
jgi:type II secretory pathway pseudopilin PulG